MHPPTASQKPVFGENTFALDVMQERLPAEFYAKLTFAIRNRRPLSLETADVIAQAMREWAVHRGATHFTHWFQPLTGLTAEKHQSFLGFDSNGRAMEQFSGKDLITGEPDASSFPHGGLRSTFEARGYTTWDPTSPTFVAKRGASRILCLPSVFVAHTGEVLDQKTPLLRSVDAVSHAAIRMLRLLGNKRVTKATPYVGCEQEYFLVDRALYLRRPDLCDLGATLQGTAPARGQQFGDHYFRATNERVTGFMGEVEQELALLGVPVRTRHNEVAPAQFELAPIHRPANIAADHNQLVMEVLRAVAPRHDLEVLLSEKPYASINGSGKHNNWSLCDSEGTNLLTPGSNQAAQLRFLIFIMAVVFGVQRHGDLLGAVTASASNDLRLGGDEAPPGVVSVHLGDYLSAHLEQIARSPIPRHQLPQEIDLGLGGVARVPKDNTDRNRTAPIAFTGDKFEFRSLGSSRSISLLNATINAMVAEALGDMSDRLEKRLADGQTRPVASLEVVREVIHETAACRYDGDCYLDSWRREARRRGLSSAEHTPAALDALDTAATRALFAEHDILSEHEMRARQRILLETYSKTVAVELRVLREMLTLQILPAAWRYQERIAAAIEGAGRVLGQDTPQIGRQREHLQRIAVLIDELLAKVAVLDQDAGGVDHEIGSREHALHAARVLRPHMAAARAVADQLEGLVDEKEWPMPRCAELLRVH